MKKFRINAIFTMIGSYIVEAETMEEAKEKVYSPTLGLPDNGYYLDDSFEVDDDGCIELGEVEEPGEEVVGCENGVAREFLGEDRSLVCKYCGYKQDDPQTVDHFAELNPGVCLHDIDYMCGACKDRIENDKHEYAYLVKFD